MKKETKYILSFTVFAFILIPALIVMLPFRFSQRAERFPGTFLFDGDKSSKPILYINDVIVGDFPQKLSCDTMAAYGIRAKDWTKVSALIASTVSSGDLRYNYSLLKCKYNNGERLTILYGDLRIDKFSADFSVKIEIKNELGDEFTYSSHNYIRDKKIIKFYFNIKKPNSPTETPPDHPSPSE